jgi:hydroxymethylpyrimidine/phosphomethylpyrimidine kinase
MFTTPTNMCTACPLPVYRLQWVLIKGGHLTEGSDAYQQQQEAWEGPQQVVTDVLFDGKNMLELTEPYIRWVMWVGGWVAWFVCPTCWIHCAK